MKEGSICALWTGFRIVGIVSILAVAAWVVWAPTAVREAMAVEEPRIEITIHDFMYVRTKMQVIRAGAPMILVVHNEDSVTHGFISPLFLGRALQGGGEGIEAFGTGIEGFHIDPGKTLFIRLTLDQQGKIAFRCDLHPEMQGELYVLDVPVG
ncbi:MAG: cupredoxin domain-containing protein [Nitrospira sp.]|nr:cupredoxin domain-containing protein [Nitrospira sp.]